ncbi:putative carboxylesterase [Gordonia hirsuta DSM 44140 = NBRC 16056]|uniref:Carboxylic ester hydrolase n=1 Tax=Gordonia hirsuta DSM 44140 = NBRC 16056 TaxID=1121927 RepID=L7L7K8_9ACTN|nr:carboxylesterase/lipase family protein [Gordonia hirsuta]GAC56914.1 putative carboxylesterase [Gordonia hirsuta DSM 44140 = NBRC 16056]
MNDADTTVQTTFGPVRGEAGPDVALWRGIPFAAPPVGDLRWRRAQDPQPWTEPRDATRFGPVCPQPVMPVIDLGEGTVQDEDCLYLNIWAPAGAAVSGARHPVLVWVHGGAYICGSGSQPLYDGTALVRTSVEEETPAIVVTVNYRMGALGFAEWGDIPGGDRAFDTNCGLSDVVQALRWVQGNIERFGGDPDRVTVFGESAGGGIVTSLLAVPAAEGLFARAIAQSSPATSVYDRKRGNRHSSLLLTELGAPSNVDAAALRKLPERALVSASVRVFNKVPVDYPGTIAYAPMIGDDLLPIDPLDAIGDGRAHDVPLLIGTNRDETSLFKWMKAPLMPVTQDQVDAMFELIAQEQPELAIPTDEDVAAAYRDGRLRRSSAKSMGISRDLGFRMPAVWIAEAHSRRAPVHLYRYDWATPLFRMLGIGATHATELPYIWGNPASTKLDISYRLGGRRTGAKVRRRMQQRWLGFAADGDPVSAESRARWQPYTPAGQHSLLIGAEDTAVTELDRNLLRAWGAQVLGFR